MGIDTTPSAEDTFLDAFAEEALNHGWATRPKWKILKMYGYERFTKSVYEDLSKRGRDTKKFGIIAEDLGVYESCGGEVILLLRRGIDWKK